MGFVVNETCLLLCLNVIGFVSEDDWFCLGRCLVVFRKELAFVLEGSYFCVGRCFVFMLEGA